jgi:DNA processing protein
MNNKHYFLALNRVKNIGPRTVLKLLTRWPNLEELFQLSAAQIEKAGLPKTVAASIAAFDLHQVEADWRWQETKNNALLTWCDPDYPPLLKEIHDPPPVLYAMGDLSSLQQPTVAMVGTRKPSITGSETAWRFAYELAAKNITIVSGLALGIDAQAHSGCLEANGKTIAVMGTGIDCMYPRQHAKLAARITENGLLLSELPLQSPPFAGHFPRRNRIISGLSLSTLVVEAAVRSGSLITARLALEQNRDVLAIPGSIYNPQSRGCHHLLQQGAKLVTTSSDVLDELGIDYDQDKRELAITLARENKNLVKCIGFEVTTVDQIMARSGLVVEKVVCDLAELEIQGIVKAVPGGYMRCTR